MTPASRLLLATHNTAKAGELGRILTRLLPGAAIEFLSGADFPVLTPPEETGATLEENALIKARVYARATGLLTLADDSGLVVEALGGRPGVHSARYGTSVEARNARVLREMEGIEPADRAARFECVAALADAGGRALVRCGTVRGRIAAAPRGTGGFGYDPIFELAEPPHAGRTAAELSPDEKDAISHRGRALAALAADLAAALRAGEIQE
jgi:XTP/dITP diphosphohydrolase